MALPLVAIHCLEQIHSPFSGLPAEVPEGGPNEADATLLFVYYGNAADFSYISAHVKSQLPENAVCNSPDQLADILSFDGGLVLEVDTDWNGVNWYGFAPAKTP